MTSALHHLFERWHSLPAFNVFSDERARLDRTTLVLKTRRGVESTGHAERLPGRFQILVRVGYSVADAHATLLHEMAHVVVGWGPKFHTVAWKQAFIHAAQQASWQLVEVSMASTHFEVHDGVREAFSRSRQRRTA